MDEAHLVKIAKALADPTRLRIFQAIVHASRICCGDVGRRFPVSQATVSHHVRILTEARLVEGCRTGQYVHVRPVPETLAAYHEALADLVRDALAACEPGEAVPASDEEMPSDEAADSPAARRARRRALLETGRG